MTIKVRHESVWNKKKGCYEIRYYPVPNHCWWPAIEFERYLFDPYGGTGPAAYFRGEKLPTDDLMAIQLRIYFDENQKLHIYDFRENKYITKKEAHAAIVRYVKQQGAVEIVE